MGSEEETSTSTSFCHHVPNLLSSFVDTFVDFSVSGLFLLPPPPPSPLPTRLPSQSRLIAIGDLHGDLDRSKQALRLAGLIDSSDRYAGGSATVVQVGDVFDRGGDELKILYFLEKLKREAARCGGNIITMNGNHEIMNVEGDFRFATESGVEEFKSWLEWFRLGNKMKTLCNGLEPPRDPLEGVTVTPRGGVRSELLDGFRARVAALRPNGPISRRFLSQNVTVLVVGDSLFVHGGLLPKHVKYGLEKINEEVRDWVNGSSGLVSPSYCRGRNAVVWLRKFSNEAAQDCDCSTLEYVLSTVPGVKRMVMGHTIQTVGINGVCDNRAIRIDVGMSKGCGGGLPEVLEINGNSGLRILTSNPLYQNAKKEKEIGLLVPEIDIPKQVEVKA
ncbi:shewanella-like protein phosphatase 2 [Lotus japonicus]|uniref:shewanella-like protein phosphatase 2 n=1 Tax=Lotus japonicus TaxID=34305 RepID=UPI00258D8C3A|nr:shewanella-like protein phosphatase 2 [Lotus japonicus]